MEWSRTTEIGNGMVPNNGIDGNWEWTGPEQWNKWDTGMQGSRTMKTMRNGNGIFSTMKINRKREWNGPEQWKSGMGWSRTMEMGKGTVPNNEIIGN